MWWGFLGGTEGDTWGVVGPLSRYRKQKGPTALVSLALGLPRPCAGIGDPMTYSALWTNSYASSQFCFVPTRAEFRPSIVS